MSMSMSTASRDACPRSMLIRDAEIQHPKISSIACIDGCREAAKKYSDDTEQRLAHYVGGLEFEIGRLCREYGKLRTAYLQSLGDDSGQPDDTQVDRIARSMARETIRHGTAHVTVPPPWPIPDVIRTALDASVRGMLNDDDDEDDEYGPIPMDSTVVPRGTTLTDDDLMVIVETIGRDAEAFARREAV